MKCFRRTRPDNAAGLALHGPYRRKNKSFPISNALASFSRLAISSSRILRLLFGCRGLGSFCRRPGCSGLAKRRPLDPCVPLPVLDVGSPCTFLPQAFAAPTGIACDRRRLAALPTPNAPFAGAKRNRGVSTALIAAHFANVSPRLFRPPRWRLHRHRKRATRCPHTEIANPSELWARSLRSGEPWARTACGTRR